MTERMMAAMDHPLVDAIGHPTGRMILRREPYAIDVEQRGRARRRDRHDARDQRQPGPARPHTTCTRGWRRRPACMIVIDSDAHSARTLAVIRYGIATARRGWLTKENVANTRTWKQLDEAAQARPRRRLRRRRR